MDYVDRWMTENLTFEQKDLDAFKVFVSVINATTKEPIEFFYNVSDNWGKGVSSSIFVDAMWDKYRADCSAYGGCLSVTCQTQNPPRCEPPIENFMTCPQDCPVCIDDPGVCAPITCQKASCAY